MSKAIKVIGGEPLHFDMLAMRIECCKCGYHHFIILDTRAEIPKLIFLADEYSMRCPESDELDK